MKTTTLTVEEIKNDFEKYLNLVISGQKIIITKDGKKVASLVPESHDSVSDSLVGTFNGEDIDLNQAKDEYFKEKYQLDDKTL